MELLADNEYELLAGVLERAENEYAARVGQTADIDGGEPGHAGAARRLSWPTLVLKGHKHHKDSRCSAITAFAVPATKPQGIAMLPMKVDCTLYTSFTQFNGVFTLQAGRKPERTKALSWT